MQRSALRRRSTVFLVVVCAVLALFVGRLLWVQLLHAGEINAEAEGRRGASLTLWGERGDILDANGVVLAGSVDRFDVTAAPSLIGDVTSVGEDGEERVTATSGEVLVQIARITGQDPAALVESVNRTIEADPESDFMYLARGATLEQYERIREIGASWLYFERHPRRHYPNGAVAGNLTGFLMPDGSEPLAGLEFTQDQCLAGRDGSVEYVRGADGVMIPGSEAVVEQARAGGDLQLTIERDTQWYAQQVIAQEVLRTGGQYGHVTVMDAKTGRLLAVAEYPSVDPNDPAASPPEDRGSRAFTSPFEPGSTIKPVTIAAAFDAGLSSPGERLVVPGSWERDGASFRDDWAHGDEPLTTAGVMALSSNIGTALIGERLTPQQRYDKLIAFGFDQATASGFLGEEPGTVHPWQDWDGQTNYTTMFGQGMETTAPQIASAYQTLANGGVRMPVQLVAGCRGPDGEFSPAPAGEPVRVISPEAASQVLATLEATAQSGHYAAEVAIPGYRVGVKTGTAQVAAGDGSYLAGRYFTSMAGVAPIDDPRYVVSVSIMDPAKIGSSAATAPAWHDVMAYVLHHNRVPASPGPWPTIPTTY